MTPVAIGRMTAAEFAAFRSELVHRYAGEQVRAGKWAEAEGLARAAADTDGRLPDGPGTRGMHFLVAREGGVVLGRVWLSLEHPDGNPGTGYVYDLEVVPDRRGQGLGRALLDAAEQVAREHGLEAVSLNVFGGNVAALALYTGTGYEVTSLQMRKPL